MQLLRIRKHPLTEASIKKFGSQGILEVGQGVAGAAVATGVQTETWKDNEGFGNVASSVLKAIPQNIVSSGTGIALGGNSLNKSRTRQAVEGAISEGTGESVNSDVTIESFAQAASAGVGNLSKPRGMKKQDGPNSSLESFRKFPEEYVSDPDSVGRKKAELAPDLLPQESEKRAALEVELNDALPNDLKSTKVSVDLTLPSNEVQVCYSLDKNGLIADLHIKTGPEATRKDIELHAITVRSIQKYSGLRGRAYRLMDRCVAFVRRNPNTPIGSVGWEAKLELEKLPAIRTNRLEQLQNSAISKEQHQELKQEIDHLEEQIERYEGLIDNLENGRGYVAAEGNSHKEDIHKTLNEVAQKGEELKDFEDLDDFSKYLNDASFKLIYKDDSGAARDLLKNMENASIEAKKIIPRLQKALADRDRRNVLQDEDEYNKLVKAMPVLNNILNEKDWHGAFEEDLNKTILILKKKAPSVKGVKDLEEIQQLVGSMDKMMGKDHELRSDLSTAKTSLRSLSYAVNSLGSNLSSNQNYHLDSFSKIVEDIYKNLARLSDSKLFSLSKNLIDVDEVGTLIENSKTLIIPQQDRYFSYSSSNDNSKKTFIKDGLKPAVQVLMESPSAYESYLSPGDLKKFRQEVEKKFNEVMKGGVALFGSKMKNFRSEDDSEYNLPKIKEIKELHEDLEAFASVTNERHGLPKSDEIVKIFASGEAVLKFQTEIDKVNKGIGKLNAETLLTSWEGGQQQFIELVSQLKNARDTLPKDLDWENLRRTKQKLGALINTRISNLIRESTNSLSNSSDHSLDDSLLCVSTILGMIKKGGRLNSCSPITLDHTFEKTRKTLEAWKARANEVQKIITQINGDLNPPIRSEDPTFEAFEAQIEYAEKVNEGLKIIDQQGFELPSILTERLGTANREIIEMGERFLADETTINLNHADNFLPDQASETIQSLNDQVKILDLIIDPKNAVDENLVANCRTRRETLSGKLEDIKVRRDLYQTLMTVTNDAQQISASERTLPEHAKHTLEQAETRLEEFQKSLGEEGSDTTKFEVEQGLQGIKGVREEVLEREKGLNENVNLKPQGTIYSAFLDHEHAKEQRKQREQANNSETTITLVNQTTRILLAKPQKIDRQVQANFAQGLSEGTYNLGNIERTLLDENEWGARDRQNVAQGLVEGHDSDAQVTAQAEAEQFVERCSDLQPILDSHIIEFDEQRRTQIELNLDNKAEKLLAGSNDVNFSISLKKEHLEAISLQNKIRLEIDLLGSFLSEQQTHLSDMIDPIAYNKMHEAYQSLLSRYRALEALDRRMNRVVKEYAGLIKLPLTVDETIGNEDSNHSDSKINSDNPKEEKIGIGSNLQKTRGFRSAREKVSRNGKYSWVKSELRLRGKGSVGELDDKKPEKRKGNIEAGLTLGKFSGERLLGADPQEIRPEADHGPLAKEEGIFGGVTVIDAQFALGVSDLKENEDSKGPGTAKVQSGANFGIFSRLYGPSGLLATKNDETLAAPHRQILIREIKAETKVGMNIDIGKMIQSAEGVLDNIWNNVGDNIGNATGGSFEVKRVPGIQVSGNSNRANKIAKKIK